MLFFIIVMNLIFQKEYSNYRVASYSMPSIYIMNIFVITRNHRFLLYVVCE